MKQRLKDPSPQNSSPFCKGTSSIAGLDPVCYFHVLAIRATICKGWASLCDRDWRLRILTTHGRFFSVVADTFEAVEITTATGRNVCNIALDVSNFSGKIMHILSYCSNGGCSRGLAHASTDKSPKTSSTQLASFPVP